MADREEHPRLEELLEAAPDLLGEHPGKDQRPVEPQGLPAGLTDQRAQERQAAEAYLREAGLPPDLAARAVDLAQAADLPVEPHPDLLAENRRRAALRQEARLALAVARPDLWARPGLLAALADLQVEPKPWDRPGSGLPSGL